MRKIERTTKFRQDYKREYKSRHGATLDADILPVLQALVNDLPLAVKYRDHAMTGDWQPHRDCHIKPDLVLIYQKPNDETLLLVRIGSHSELAV
jgi:mRNA interferase YafQ